MLIFWAFEWTIHQFQKILFCQTTLPEVCDKFSNSVFIISKIAKEQMSSAKGTHSTITISNSIFNFLFLPGR